MTGPSKHAGRLSRSSRSAASGAPGWGRAPPLIGYLLLTYALSWSLWGLASPTGGAVSFVLVVAGGFGPPAAAAVMLWFTARSWRDWKRSIVAWRVPLRFYAYALLLPACLQLGTNVVLAMTGAQID